MKRTYETLGTRRVFAGHAFAIDTDDIRLPTGKETTRDIVRHPGAVVILPQRADGTLLLVDQFRYAVGKDLLEFPAGTLERGEVPLDCAKREIMEEVKHAAKEWIELGTLYPAPGFCDEMQHLYLARELTPAAADGDEDEIMDVVQLTVFEFEQAMARGDILDAKSIAASQLARLRGLL